jgi:nicotinate dehydrogenase large molybdopterin subunit
MSGQQTAKGETYIEGVRKVTGACKYTFDLAKPGMLVGKLLYAQFPRARIQRLDTSAAELVPGVAAVVTSRDIPGERLYGMIVKDQPILAIDQVHFVGDIVAAVAAEDEDAADEALRAIEVEYDPLPGVFTTAEAMTFSATKARDDLESNILAHYTIRHGDVREGFAQADVVIEDTYRTAPVEQLFLETEGALAIWDGTQLTIQAGGQYPHRDLIQVAEALAIPANRIRVVYPYLGGGFGGKYELHVQIPVALLAMKAGRPVKLVRSRFESFMTHPKRHAFEMRYKLGARSDGALTAIEAELIGDAGPYSNLSVAVLAFACQMAPGCYNVANARVDAYAVATNNLLGGAMRGFGGPQAAFAQEQMIDVLAEKLGMDPVALRLMNAMTKGSRMPNGAVIENEIGLKETIQRAAEAARWETRDDWLQRQPTPHERRGLGVASIWHGMGLGRGLLDHASVYLEMLPDGTAVLRTAMADYGQGAHSVQAQMAAMALGLMPEDIRVVTPDTDATPDTGPAAASRGVYMTGNAILQAAAVIRRSLLEIAAEELEARQDDLILEDRRIRARQGPPERSMSVAEAARRAWLGNKRLRADGHVEMWPSDAEVAENAYPYLSRHYLYATDIAQVLVDIETGQVRVEKIWAAHDVGHAINRLALAGQIEGGAAQGVGFALMEELQQTDGQLVNGTLEGYSAPSAVDIPNIQVIVVEVPEPDGPFGAKGIAEATVTPVAPAIANAIADAVGIRPHRLPMTPERVLFLIGAGSGMLRQGGSR